MALSSKVTLAKRAAVAPQLALGAVFLLVRMYNGRPAAWASLEQFQAWELVLAEQLESNRTSKFPARLLTTATSWLTQGPCLAR
jgi:hypothetical protein